MACARCGGLIVKESVSDREGSSQVVLMDRCLQCGNIEDPVSARNRAQINLSRSEKGKTRRDPEHPYPPIELAKGESEAIPSSRKVTPKSQVLHHRH